MSKVKRGAVWLTWVLFLIVSLAAGVAQAKMMEINGKMYDIAQPGEFQPGEVVVKLHPGVSKDVVEGLESLTRGKVKGHLPEYDLYLLAVPPATGKEAQKAQVDEAVKALKRHPLVKHAYPNSKFSIPKPPETPASVKGKKTEPPIPGAVISQALPPVEGSIGMTGWQWHLDKIKFNNAGVTPASAPKVAVVDTGVDYNHPDLAANVVKGWDFVDDDGDPMDEAGHGTHVAGLVAASPATGGVSGVSPTSKVLAVRVLDQYGSGTFFWIISGIVYAKNSNAKIINLSLGGYALEGSSDFNDLKTAIDDCFAAGKVVCVAAGNEDNAESYMDYYGYSPPNYVPIPAWYPNSFTVAATEQNDCRTFFSNYDNSGTLNGHPFNFTFVDIVAPGWSILSTVPTNQGFYARYDGTSMATPIVAGCAARVWAKYTTLTNEQVQNRLRNTGVALGSASGAKGFYTTEYRPDLMKALGLSATGFCGAVYTAQSGAPLAGAKVVANPSGTTVYTNGSGFFTITGLTGGTTYTLNVSNAGHGALSVASQVAAADKIKDVALPTHLTKLRADNQWAITFSHRTWHPGYYDSQYSYFYSWWPVPWASSYGLWFAPRLEQDGSVIVDPSFLGNLVEPPYAAMTTDGLQYTSGCINLVISQVAGGSTYRVWTLLDNDSDSFWEWGSYKGPGQSLRARFYNCTTYKGQAVANTATGSGPYWWVADIVGNAITIQNKFGITPPPF
jgi:subtilisin family serine protease